MRNIFTLLMITLLLSTIGVNAQALRKSWDFRNGFSVGTVNALKGDLEEFGPNKYWRNYEGDATKADDQHFWCASKDAKNADGYACTHNGGQEKVISELEGLTLGFTAAKKFVITYNGATYPNEFESEGGPALGEPIPHGNSYVWLNGKNETIKFKAEVGQTIKIGVESHAVNRTKLGEARGISLTASGGTLELVSGNPVPTYYTECEWNLTGDPGAIAELTIKSSNGCHIYYIIVGEGDESTMSQSLDAQEWEILQSLTNNLIQHGWENAWDLSCGKEKASSLKGVTIYNGHISSINMSNLGLKGNIPLDVFRLPYLQTLNLSNNLLTGDIGVTMAAYIKMNPSAQIALRHVNISHNQFTGNIGLFAACLPSLQTLDASGNCLEDVYPMISPNVTSLNIGQQTINRIVELDLSNLTVEAMAGKLPSILLYNHAKQTFIPEISILCTSGEFSDYLNNWSIILSYKNGKATVPYASDANVYYGQSGDMLNVGVVNDDGSLEGTTFRIKLNFENGDANFDGQVNILDLQTTLNYMFEEYTNKPFNFTASNLWKDEVINVQDAVCFVNLLLDANAAPAQQVKATKRVAAQPSEASASVTIENGYLTINSSVPVSAFDIMVSTSWQAKVVSALNDMGFTCTSKQSGNNLHLVGYSLNGSEIPAGETAICELNSGILLSAMLSDRDAKEISVSLNVSTTTGVQSSIFNPSSHEVYRIPMGARRAIIIDTTGRKTLIKDEK